MKNLLLIVLFLIMLPVSNEQILLNMGEDFKWQFTPTYFLEPLTVLYDAVKAEDDGYSYYTVIADDGTVFTVKYSSILFGYGVIVISDSGLGISSWYWSTSSLIAAINAALAAYNATLPIGAPICLLPFGLLYLIRKRNKNGKETSLN